MKWPKDQVTILLQAFTQCVDNLGHSKEEIRENYKDNHPLLVMYDLWRIVQYDITADDNHPAFKEFGRVRNVEFNPDFVLYPPGCHDSHFDTVLKHVKKELGL